ncbi:MAG TPA: flagellar export chaperone FliS [Bryobacteraceae bacterium]|nr:flagellar export chaperone FliS [Bryobacteraceae bacterium]
MFYGAHDTYLESRVLSADPLELVRLLYQGAIDAVQDARHYLAEGKILDRSRSITRAVSILVELTASLDHERGGEIASRLAGLYDYMQKKLLEANFQQIDAPLGEVLGLLTTLSEGWAGISKPTEAAASAGASPWSQSLAGEPEANYAPASWSL